LPVALYWQTERTTATDYSIFLHLVDEKGALVAQQDGPPQDGYAPTSWWRPGDRTVDRHALAIPSNLPTGHYRLEIGVYDSASGARLPLFDDHRRQPDDAWVVEIDLQGAN
jgi:hypothetical protein